MRPRCAPWRAKRRRVVPGRSRRLRVAAVAKGHETPSCAGNMQSASDRPSRHSRRQWRSRSRSGMYRDFEDCRQEASQSGRRSPPDGFTSDTRPSYRCAPWRATRRRVRPWSARACCRSGKGARDLKPGQQHAERIPDAVKPFAMGVTNLAQLRGSELGAKPLPERGVPGQQRMSPRSQYVRRQGPQTDSRATRDTPLCAHPIVLSRQSGFLQSLRSRKQVPSSCYVEEILRQLSEL
jgi:hypothetical protein